MQTARNVAIILLLALIVDQVPGGGNAAQAILTALSIAFLAAIAWFGFRLYRDQQLTLDSLTDGRKAILFGAVGAIVLLVVGFEEFQSFEGGILVWIMLMAASIGAIFLVVREATSYS